MRPANFDIHVIIESLIGTTGSLDNTLEEYYPGMEYSDLTSSDHATIDNEMFECGQCGWWCEAGEAHEGNMEDVCSDCHEEKDGEEEEE